MTVHWATPLRALGIATALGCGSSGAARLPPTGSATTVLAGDDAGNPMATASDTNPDGFLYPGPPYGRNARSGTTAGSIMANFKFLGYVDAVVSAQPARIALADYYDPCTKRYKLIHLTVASVWCVPCNAETDAFVAAKAKLDSMGVVVLQALDDGPAMGTGATVGDLDRWIGRHHTNFTELLDPGLQNLAGFFNAAAVPWNCDLDPRTMEIVGAHTGWVSPGTTPGPVEDVMYVLAPALDAVKLPQSYPASVACK